MTFITHGFRWYPTYETSGSPLRFMLRRSSLVECVNVLHGTGVYKDNLNIYTHGKTSLSIIFHYNFDKNYLNNIPIRRALFPVPGRSQALFSMTPDARCPGDGIRSRDLSHCICKPPVY